MHRGSIGWGWGGDNFVAALGPAVLGELETRVVQALEFLVFSPLRCEVVFFGVFCVFRRGKEHTPPLWEMHKCHWNGASHCHYTHPSETCCCRESCAREEQ